MDLLNRYLNAVAARLPKREQGEIQAEIREELLSRIEDREEELGRPLSEREVVSLLKARGHPLIVAASYGSSEPFLSPIILPFYWFAMQVIIGTDLLAHIAYSVIALVSGDDVRHVLSVCFSSLWPVSMYLVGTLTFSGLILDRIGVGGWLARAWNPRFLPSVSSRTPSPTIFAVDLIVIVGLVLFTTIRIPILTVLSSPAGMSVRPSSIFGRLDFLFILLAIAQLAIHCLERMMAANRMAVFVAKLIHGTATLGVITVLYRARPWLAAGSMNGDLIQPQVQTLTLVIGIALGVVTAITSIRMAITVSRLFRIARSGRISAVPKLRQAL